MFRKSRRQFTIENLSDEEFVVLSRPKYIRDYFKVTKGFYKNYNGRLLRGKLYLSLEEYSEYLTKKVL